MFNNSPDKRRRGARPEEMRRRLLAVHGLPAGRTRLTSWRYEKVLRECTPADLVYMDPPYQGTCGRRDRRYWGEFSHSRLCDELEKLDRRHVPFVLSYDGRLGRRTYGRDLPESLGLRRIVIRAGRPAQSMLLGGPTTRTSRCTCHGTPCSCARGTAGPDAGGEPVSTCPTARGTVDGAALAKTRGPNPCIAADGMRDPGAPMPDRARAAGRTGAPGR